MMQAADFGKLDDLACRGKLDGPAGGGALVEGEICSRLMVIGDVASEDAVEVTLAEDENVMQILRRTEPITRSAKGFRRTFASAWALRIRLRLGCVSC